MAYIVAARFPAIATPNEEVVDVLGERNVNGAR